MREEYRTSLFRGLTAGAFAAAVAFFNLWPQDVTSQALVSATVLAGLSALGPFLGFGMSDARRNDRR